MEFSQGDFKKVIPAFIGMTQTLAYIIQITLRENAAKRA